ncbi:MAG TPA: STAS domain-containing protein [Dokdonella sp.]|nr:STAS domain-containing protein [Dokdonella sp.]
MSAPLVVERGPDDSIAVAGRIDVSNAASALAAGDPLSAVTARTDVDLKGLESADSVTLAVLLAWSARARHNGGALVFRDVSPRLRSIAHLSDAEDLLGIGSP